MHPEYGCFLWGFYFSDKGKSSEGQGHNKRISAMAIGLTDHVWSYLEYICITVHHDPILKQERDERIQQLLTFALFYAIMEINPAKISGAIFEHKSSVMPRYYSPGYLFGKVKTKGFILL